MRGTDELMGLMEDAVSEMDRCMGWRNAGIAVSGAGTPSFKHIATHEDPTRFTIRVLIAPVVSSLGYGELRGPFPDRPVSCAGSVLVSTAMNRPLDEESMVDHVRRMRGDRGIATDGFRWVAATRTDGGFVMTRVDLRPYYVEILERRRFRCAERVDRGEAMRFLRTFTRRIDRLIRIHSSPRCNQCRLQPSS